MSNFMKVFFASSEMKENRLHQENINKIINIMGLRFENGQNMEQLENNLKKVYQKIQLLKSQSTQLKTKNTDLQRQNLEIKSYQEKYHSKNYQQKIQLIKSSLQSHQININIPIELRENQIVFIVKAIEAKNIKILKLVEYLKSLLLQGKYKSFQYLCEGLELQKNLQKKMSQALNKKQFLIDIMSGVSESKARQRDFSKIQDKITRPRQNNRQEFIQHKALFEENQKLKANIKELDEKLKNKINYRMSSVNQPTNIKYLRQQIDELERQNRGLQKIKVKYQDNKKHIDLLLTQSMNTCKSLFTEKTNLEKKYSQEIQESFKLKQRIDNLSEELKVTTQNNKSIQKDKIEEIKEKEKQSKLNEKLSQQIIELKEELIRLTKEMNMNDQLLRNTIKQLSHELKIYKTKNQIEISKYRREEFQQRREIKAENEELKERVAVAVFQMNTLRSDDEVQEIIFGLQIEIKSLQEKVVELSEKFFELGRKYDKQFNKRVTIGQELNKQIEQKYKKQRSFDSSTESERTFYSE